MQKIIKDRYYILGTPCSGKTHFIRSRNGYYNGIKLIDFDYLKPYRDYRAFKTCKEGVIIGGIAGDGLEIDTGKCTYLSVLIDKDTLRRYTARRKAHGGRGKKWSNIWNVLEAREELERFSRENNIPVFGSFEDCLDYVEKVSCTAEK